MEIITFTNANDDDIVFSATSDYKLVSRTGLGAGDIVPQTSSAFNLNGSIYRGSKLGVRYITVNFSFTETTASEFYTTTRSMISILNPLLGEGLLEYENDIAKYRIDAAVVSGPEFVQTGALSGVVQVIFMCAQPLFESDTEYSNAFTGGSLTTIRTATLTNSGDYETPLRIEFEGQLNTATAGLVNVGAVLMQDTEYQIDVVTALATGEKLVIDTDIRDIQVTLIATDNSETSAFDLIDADSQFFQMPVGERAYMATILSGAAGTTCTLYWRERFAGVTL